MEGVRQIEIPYSPRKAFLPFHGSNKRWSVLICHRRAGKTVSVVNHLIRDALTHTKATYAYIGPTYSQSKRVAWGYIKEFASPVPGVTFNEAELRADFPTGSRIYVLGAENPDSLRGLALDGVVFDEYSQQPAHIFGEIIRPSLADRQGYAVWIGTVKGKNHLWRLWDDNKANSEWFTMYLRASESGILPQAELDDARKTMSEPEYLQEFELSTEAAIKGAYYADGLIKARQDKRITRVPHDPSLPVETAWDLGIGDATAIWFFQRAGQELHLIDYLENTGKDLAFYASEIEGKKYLYHAHHLPHDAKARELGTGKSREEVLRTLLGQDKIKIVKQMRVDDGIQQVRLLFPKLWIDAERCMRGIDAIEQYRKEWDDNRGDFKDHPLHDFTSHAADALRMLALSEKPFLGDLVKRDLSFNQGNITY